LANRFRTDLSPARQEAALWVGGAVFQLLPGQNSGQAIQAAVTGGTQGALARSTRTFATMLGIALALDFWVLGQHFGAIYSGQGTYPNTGPFVVLMGVVIVAGRAHPRVAITKSWLGSTCAASPRHCRLDSSVCAQTELG
jgi:hypothetical protein